MEYSTDGGSTWKNCTAELTFAAVGWTGSSDVTVQFRTKATEEAFASAEKELTISAVETPPSGGDGGDSYRPSPRPDPKPEPPKPPVAPDLKPGETTTETKPDGSSVKSEEKANGDKLLTETKPDGSAVSEGKKPDGTTAKTTTNAQGKTKAEVQVTEKAVEQAQQEKKPLELPLPPVEAEKDSEKAPEVKIQLQTSQKTVEVSIPVEKPSAGTVAVIVKPDGTEDVLPKSVVDEKGLTLEIANGATVKIVDNSKIFLDVHPVHHWAAEAVDFVASREIFNGTGKNLFKPNHFTSRGMITQVLYNMESRPDYQVENDFGDVPDNQWYTDAINWAAENNVIAGYTNGNFGPDDRITREQLAVILYRYAGHPSHKSGAAQSFTDAQRIGLYAREAMDWAEEAGIVKGTRQNLINPKGLATRAESAAVMSRFLKQQ